MLSADYTNVNGMYGSFYTAMNGVTFSCTNNRWLNNIALNVKLGGFFTDLNTEETLYRNCAAWNCYWDAADSSTRHYLRGDNTLVSNCTIGVSDISEEYYYHTRGDSGNSETIKNTILCSLHNGYAMRDINTKNYNCYYNNTRNDYDSSLGAYSKTNVNPLYHPATNSSGGLKHLPRIEAGSTLKGQGEGGADIGANVLTRIGVSGTLYGETGYNTDTGRACGRSLARI